MAGYSENAIAAKVKALYGKRLTENDYRLLLQRKTVGEVAAYLKQETCYSESLGEVKEELIHRGQLENLVRKRSLDIQIRLLKFGFSDNMFSRLYVAEKEIQQLLFALRMLGSESMARYITAFPAYLDKYVSFDLFQLAKISDYDQLLDIVKGSPYYQILGPFRPVSSAQNIDVMGCEAALLNYYYTRAFKLIRDRFKGETQVDLMHILQSRIDLHNVMLIYRMKRYFKMPPDEINALLIPYKGLLQMSLIKRAVEAEDAPGVLDALQKNQLVAGRLLRSPPEVKLEWTLESMRQALCRKVFRFSIQPIVVLFSYMTLLDIETANIVNIIEGTRYNVSADEINRLLVI